MQLVAESTESKRQVRLKALAASATLYCQTTLETPPQSSRLTSASGGKHDASGGRLESFDFRLNAAKVRIGRDVQRRSVTTETAIAGSLTRVQTP